MMHDLDPQLEAAVRRQLTRLIDAIETPPPPATAAGTNVRPSDGPGDARTAGRRPRTLLLAAAAVLAVIGLAGLAGVAVDSSSDDDVRTGSPDSRDMSTLPAPAQTDTTAAADDPSSEPDVSNDRPGALDCEGVARDGVVGSGGLPDGRQWSVRVSGTPPSVRTEVLVEGVIVDQSTTGPGSWPPVTEDDQMAWGFIDDDQVPGSVALFTVSSVVTRVDVALWDDSAEHLCPSAVPGIEDLRHAAIALPVGNEVRELTALDGSGRTLDRERPTRFLGPLDPATSQVRPDSLTEMTVPAANGPVTLQAGSAGDDGVIAAQLSAPWFPGFEFSIEDTPRRLQGHWMVSTIDNQHVVWGVTPSEITRLTVYTTNGEVLTAATVPIGLDSSAFLVVLPGLASIEGIGAERADEVVALEATDLEVALAPLVPITPALWEQTAFVPVVRH